MVKNVIILHGWTSHLGNWKPFVNLLKKKSFNVFQPTMPGFGKIKIKKPWSTQNYVDWLENFIKSKKLTKVVLIGHSFGCQVSIQYTAQYSHKVSRLILISAGGIRSNFTLKRSLFFILAKIGKLLFSIPLIKKLALPARKLLYKTAREGDYYKASPVMKKTLAIVTKEDQRNTLPKITIQTLILWGQKDSITPLKDGRTMKKLLPNSQLITFPNDRHGLPFTNSNQVIEKISWFIS